MLIKNFSDERDTTKYQTKEDQTIIQNLIQNYIVDERTIILLVLLHLRRYAT